MGVLLFSRNRNMICCLAVDPEYRQQGLASILMRKALAELDRSREITVSTFRENDEKGIAPRALYKKFGFQKVNKNEHYPVDCFKKEFSLDQKVKKARLYITACRL